MARQFIYHMQGLSKTWPGGKKVLDNIHLSFYPDAKIGVLGVNGSGKSTLARDVLHSQLALLLSKNNHSKTNTYNAAFC